MTFGTLRALHTSIGNAIDDLERLYQERSPRGEPIEFPRPDVPYYSAEKHAPNDELAEKLSADPAVTFVAQQIVAACDQLGAAVNRPWNTLIRTIQEVSFVRTFVLITASSGGYAGQGQLVASLRFLEAAHIVEILREAGPQGLHVREICRLVAELRPKSAAGKPENLTSTRLGERTVLVPRAGRAYRCHLGVH